MAAPPRTGGKLLETINAHAPRVFLDISPTTGLCELSSLKRDSNSGMRETILTKVGYSPTAISYMVTAIEGGGRDPAVRRAPAPAWMVRQTPIYRRLERGRP